MNDNHLDRAVAQEYVRYLAELCGSYSLTNLNSQAAACERMLQSDELIDLPVFGQFKAGKSSFLNFVVGRDVLPVNALPATAAVTRISYGPHARFVVHHLDHSEREIAETQLADYVTEERNPDNARKVSWVEITLPELAPYRSLRFVDTPGLGSVFAHNTQTSIDWMPNAHGAIVAIAINQPLSEHDVRVIQKVSRYTPEITILLTKADLCTEQDRQAIFQFTSNHVRKHLNRNVRILPFSTRPEYELLQQALRDFLLRDIVGRQQEIRAKVVQHKIRGLSSEVRAYLDVALHAAKASEDNRHELQQALEEERRTLHLMKSEIQMLVRDAKSKARTIASARFHEYYAPTVRRLTSELRKTLPTWTGHLAQRTEQFRTWTNTVLHDELSRLSSNGAAFLEPVIVDTRASLARHVEAFQDRLAQHIEKALGIHFTSAKFTQTLDTPRQPDIHIGRVFDTHLDLLWFLIPMRLFRSLFDRHCLKLVPWEVEKNLARLAGQWSDAVGVLIDSLASQAIRCVEEELATVERLAGDSTTDSAAVEGNIDKLKELENSLRVTVKEGEEVYVRRDRPSPGYRDS